MKYLLGLPLFFLVGCPPFPNAPGENLAGRLTPEVLEVCSALDDEQIETALIQVETDFGDRITRVVSLRAWIRNCGSISCEDDGACETDCIICGAFVVDMVYDDPEQGPRGLPGVSGPRGPQGPQGVQGIPGTPAAEPTLALCSQTATSCSSVCGGLSVVSSIRGSCEIAANSGSCSSGGFGDAGVCCVCRSKRDD